MFKKQEPEQKPDERTLCDHKMYIPIGKDAIDRPSYATDNMARLKAMQDMIRDWKVHQTIPFCCYFKAKYQTDQFFDRVDNYRRVYANADITNAQTEYIKTVQMLKEIKGSNVKSSPNWQDKH